MTDITNGKTYPQLDEETLPIVGTDVLAIYRGPGPLSQIPASGLLDYIETGIDPLVTEAEDARDIAVAAAATAETAEDGAVVALNGATAQALLAQQYAGEAENARLTAGFYPDARANVPRGITGTSGLVAGSGGTNGTFALAYTGGNFAVNPSGTFTVTAGALASVTITGPGLYIGASPTAPTAVLTASAGLTGASVVLDAGFLAGSGEYYWTDDATSSNLMALYQNVAGVATASSPLVNLTKTLSAAVAPCTVAAPNARSYPMTPVTGFAVSGVGTSQLFFGIAGATNAEGQLGSVVTATIAGVFSGAATEIVLPNGNSLPAGAIQLNSPFIIQPSATRSKYVLVSPAFDAQMMFVQLEWVSGTGNTLVYKMPFSETKLPANGQNVRFAFKTQGAKPFGSPSLAVRNYQNDTDLIVATAIYDEADSAALTAADLWAANQTVEVQVAASSRFNIVKYPDNITSNLAYSMVTSELKSPKSNRPVSSLQMDTNLTIIGVKLPIGNYVDAAYANNEDYLRVGFMNVAPFMGLGTQAPDGFMALNSLWANVRNQKITLSNFVYKALDSGTTVETGLVWSAFENVFIALDMAEPSLFALAGRAHGDVTEVTTTRRGYRKDSATGYPVAATRGATLTVTMNTSVQITAGERVRFSGVTGMTELNDTWFTLTSIAGNPSVLTFTGVNSTAWGAFTNPSSGVGIADYAEREVILPAQADITTEWNGIRIEQECTYFMTTPAGTVLGVPVAAKKWAFCTDLTTFEPGADYLVKFEWTADFTHPDITITPGTREGGYVVMCPMTGVNRSASTVAGVQGAATRIDLRNDTQTLFGNAEIKKNWNADFDDIQLVVENIAGAGFTHFEDTGSGPVGVPYAAQVFDANADYGPKDYWPVYPVSTPVSLAGKVLTGGAKYNLVRADPIP